MSKKDVGFKEEWSRSTKIKRKDHLISHVYLDAKKFVPSYEQHHCPPVMSHILGWEYGRQWLKERNEFVKMRVMAFTPKRIKPNFTKWLESHKRKETKRLCGK